MENEQQRIVRATVYIPEPDTTLRVVSHGEAMVYEVQECPTGYSLHVYATPSAIPTTWIREAMFALVNAMRNITGYWGVEPRYREFGDV